MLTFEERVHVQKVFNREIGEQKAAEFAVHLQESIDGLQSNNQAYVEEYRRMLAADHSVQSDDYNAVPTVIKSFPMRDAYPVGDKVGSVEEAGYEFANCGTEEYRKVCWLDVLLQRAAQQPTPAEDANASPMDEVTVWECDRCKFPLVAGELLSQVVICTHCPPCKPTIPLTI